MGRWGRRVGGGEHSQRRAVLGMLDTVPSSASGQVGETRLTISLAMPQFPSLETANFSALLQLYQGSYKLKFWRLLRLPRSSL